jgi:predicted GNAT family acetyltransferase
LGAREFVESSGQLLELPLPRQDFHWALLIPTLVVMSAAVRDNPALSRFELDANGATAVSYYTLAGGVMTFTHTEVPLQARGGGIASRLIAGALEAARARGLKIVVRCPFVGAYLAKHPEFNDLLA